PERGFSIDSSASTKRDRGTAEAAPDSDWPLHGGRSTPMGGRSRSKTARAAAPASESSCRCVCQRSPNITKTQLNAKGDMYETLRNDLGGAVPLFRIRRCRTGHSCRVPASAHDARQ